MPRLSSGVLRNPASSRAIPSWKTHCCDVQEGYPCAPHNGISCDRRALLTLRFDRSNERDTQQSCSGRGFRFWMSLAVWVISTRPTSRDPSNASLEKPPPKSFKGKSSCRFYTRPLRQQKLYSFPDLMLSELRFFKRDRNNLCDAQIGEQIHGSTSRSFRDHGRSRSVNLIWPLLISSFGPTFLVNQLPEVLPILRTTKLCL